MKWRLVLSAHDLNFACLGVRGRPGAHRYNLILMGILDHGGDSRALTFSLATNLFSLLV